MVNINNTQDIRALVEDVLERLEPRLRHLARRQIARAPEIVELSSDDLYQEMCLQIVERVYRENNFLIQADAYISQYGLWAAMNHIRRIRAKYSSWHIEVETDDERFYYTGRAGPCPDTSVEVREIYNLVAKCPEEYQQVWTLLSRGYTYAETAKLMDSSPYVIGARKKKLLHAVREAYNAPLSHKSAVLEGLC